MSDFAYGSYDSSTLKVAFENLRRAEQQGFWLGLFVGSPLGVWIVSRQHIAHKIGAGPGTKLFSAVFVGSLVYYCYKEGTVLEFLLQDKTTMWQQRS